MEVDRWYWYFLFGSRTAQCQSILRKFQRLNIQNLFIVIRNCILKYNYWWLILSYTSFFLFLFEQSCPLSTYHLHHQTHLLGYQLILAIAVYLDRIMLVIVLHYYSFNKKHHQIDCLCRKFLIILEERIQRPE